MAPKSNSASSWLGFKIQYVMAFVMFWATTVVIAIDIAQLVNHIPLDAQPSSALLYLLLGFAWLYWASRKILPSWMALIPALAAASVLLLKWDSYLFSLLFNVGWLTIWFNLTRGYVWPWGGPWTIMFVPDAVINDAIDLLDHEQKTKGT